MATTYGLEEAILAAIARTAAPSSAAGTTRVTRPAASASSAEIASPVSSISIALRDPTARLSATIGVEQKRPIFTPGVAKRASCAATARSHEATSWQPAAVAVACTCAITGCGMFCSVSISRVQASKSSR